jgi:hypothetical protein
MTTIDSIFIAFINYIGGSDVIYGLWSLLFLYTFLYVVYKITV